MYQDKLKKFKNIENLAGKSWEHAVAIDVLKTRLFNRMLSLPTNARVTIQAFIGNQKQIRSV